MDINAFNAAKTYGLAKEALRPELKKPELDKAPGEAFQPAKILEEMAASVVKSEQTASAYMVGKADPHSVVEALASAELAVETAVTLRNRVVEAYQELMRMPV
ncbi:MAG: flagellar hook-basal body complex protein FliE [Amphiplicatus sp.]